MMNTFIQSRSSLKNHTRYPDQNRQGLYLFSDQNAAKTLPFWAAHVFGLYKGVPTRAELLKAWLALTIG